MPFQSSVNAQPAPGLEGGWASVNPHASRLQPSTGDPTEAAYASWKVGASGVIVGRFAFCQISTGLVTSAHPGTTGVVVAFVQRDQPVFITAYLGQASNLMYAGQEISVLDACDVWCRFAAGAAAISPVYASYADGSAIASAAAPTTTYSVTTTSGSTALTGIGAGAVAGQPISGTGIPAGAFLATLTGTTGTLSANATASGTVTATATTGFLTRWTTDSAAAAGELAKISTRG
jgi:hypothetical protein